MVDLFARKWEKSQIRSQLGPLPVLCITIFREIIFSTYRERGRHLPVRHIPAIRTPARPNRSHVVALSPAV